VHDKYEQSGTASGHYFHQDLLIAKKIYIQNPVKHVDVGSRVDGFVAHVAVFRAIEVLDIRATARSVDNIRFIHLDLLNLPESMVEYCDSLSCLHALEHFGLGRYGDRLDINGHRVGLLNLHRMLKPNGILYLSVPIGKERIEFNAHRVFSLTSVLNWTTDLFDLVSFSFVDDAGNLHESAPLSPSSIVENFGLTYGCGIFELRKLW
jgi:SAM-dependent methyltransferase